ncbi:hypothetical protein ANTQUA_LOCUS4012 [Anthophora quadrimaculata]
MGQAFVAPAETQIGCLLFAANDRRPRVGGHAGHRSRNLRHVVSSARDHPLLSADHARRGFLTVSSSPNVA